MDYNNTTGIFSNFLGGGTYTLLFIGIAIAAIVFIVAYVVIGYANTRPIVQGFQDIDTAPYVPTQVDPTSVSFSCAEVIPQAAQSLQLIQSGVPSSSDALRDYKSLLAKISCFKKDISSTDKAITATKDLDFLTQQDIQPVADLTARCFAKSVPERDLEIAYEKWDMAAEALLQTLGKEGGHSTANVQKAYQLFKEANQVSRQTALKECKQSMLSEYQGIEGFENSPHDPIGYHDDTKTLGASF
jgi:hypothetical protein